MKTKTKSFKKVKLPVPLPCPCCGKCDLYIGAMSSDSQGVHCININDSIVDMMLMANRRDEKAQMEIIESPLNHGCGLRMVRCYPTEYPEDLQDLPYEKQTKEFERRTLAEAIHAWNVRC